MPQVSDPSRPPRRLSIVPIAAVGALLSCIAGFYFANIHPFVHHRRVREEMDVAILKLAVNRPPDLTDDQWAYCIVWTWNLHSNYGSHPSYVPTADLERILVQFQKKTERGTDLDTIDWFWDQYIQAYPRARSYDSYRPTAESNRESFEAGAHGGNPLSQWRENYEQRVAQQAR